MLAIYCRAPLQGEFKYMLLIANGAGKACVPEYSANTSAHVCTCGHAHVEVWMLIYKAHLQKHQMSKVHCGTLLTSNVTNNFFLQLHCSNPFSGLWNGNIITFPWCSAFDKTATCWAECLTELDASPKPSPLSTLLLSPYSSPLFLSLL